MPDPPEAVNVTDPPAATVGEAGVMVSAVLPLEGGVQLGGALAAGRGATPVAEAVTR